MARFEDSSNLYRYTLCCPGETPEASLRLTRGELISSLHKLIRRARTAELCYLVRAFFEAVQHEKEVRSVTTSLKGSISNFINRITLSLFEEGVLLHCSDEIQKTVCNALVAVAKCHTAGIYTDIAEPIETALKAVHGVYRGRLGSVVMAYSAHKHPLPDNEAERQLIAKLDPEYVNVYSMPKHFATYTKKQMPILHPLTLLSPYKECAEFRRVCVMNAPIAPIIPDEYKISTDTPIGDSVPTRELLREIGALDDVHTKGKHNREAWDEFLNKGMKVANETPLRLIGRSYSELEALYNEGKHKDLDNGVWDVKKPKKAKVAKVAKAAKAEKAPIVTKPLERCFQSEAEVLALTDNSKLLGFKNGTVIGELREAVGSLASGEGVFFKMGESYEDCKFAVQCAKWQEEVGLPFATTELVWVKPSLEWWREIRTESTNKGDWSASLQKSLNARIKREQDPEGYMPCLVSTCFEGKRLTDFSIAGPPGFDKAGLSLAKNLLFAKYVGIKDVGPFNMLVSKEHDVLLVDMGKPSAKQMEEYNTKGLFTSHKFGSDQKEAIKNAFVHHRDELVSFHIELQKLPMASGDDTFWNSWI